MIEIIGIISAIGMIIALTALLAVKLFQLIYILIERKKK